MKKALLLVLAFAMALSLSLTASATTFDNDPAGENNWASENVDQGDVVIKVQDEHGDPVEADLVYKVVVEWDSLAFNFSLENGVTPVYNEETHLYSYTDEEGAALEDVNVGSWDVTEATITVSNHSNAEVTVDALIGGASSVEKYDVTATLTPGVNNTATLASAEGTTSAGVQNTYTVAVSGAPKVLDFTLATITVTIGVPTP